MEVNIEAESMRKFRRLGLQSEVEVARGWCVERRDSISGRSKKTNGQKDAEIVLQIGQA